ncbi:ABC transporter substrate-binding protein [Pyruvatibacter sp.]|uniref:ABC transporter substrate-binding protein n=1 Tax=Pyruvatibacter sp. TaxID=1981328 RepID=UPI0032EC111A
MKSWGTITRALFGALVLAIPLSAAVSPVRADTMVYALYDDIKDWDPAVAFSLEAILLRNVYEPLVRYAAPKPGDAGDAPPIEGVLATDWQASDDALTWTFTLREGVTFHDGSPFNAAAAKAALDRTISLGQGAAFIWDGVEEITAPDDTTLVIRTSRPIPIDLIASAQYGAYIYSPTAAENGTEWFNQGNASGTGPYKVAGWTRGQQIVLEQNDDYWRGWQDSQFKRIIMKVVAEAATQAQLIRSGGADFVTLLPVDLLERLKNDPDIAVDLAPSWINTQALINTQKYPTDDINFRRALTYAWDYASIADEIYQGTADVARGPVPTTMWGHNADLAPPAFDLEEAKRLIDASGIPPRDRKISAAYVGTAAEVTNSLLVFQAYLATIGVELQLRPGPWGKIWDDAKNLRTAPNIQVLSWWPTYPTPADWLQGMYRTEDPTLFNLAHYSNPDFDALVDEARTLESTDREAAVALYAKAQQILVDDAVGIFFADVSARYVHRANISGVEKNPAYVGVDFYSLRREQL